MDPKTFAPNHYLWSFKDGVGTVTLNRPDRKNPLTFESYAELRNMFRDLVYAKEVQAIIVTGAGGNFCSGGDVHEIIGPLVDMDMPDLLDFTRMTCDLTGAIRLCRRPVVAGLNGTVAGAGAVIATACDIRIAAESAKIAYLFTRVGLSGADMGVAWLLPRIIGLAKASELLMTGAFIGADEAHRVGVINRVFAPEELAEGTRKMVKSMLVKGPVALRFGMEAVLRGWDMDQSAGEALETEYFGKASMTEDMREGMAAFLEKRKPEFKNN